MRKLATIEKILDIQPIPGADAIEVATVRGWHVVVKKGEFKVGDTCVYMEIDSFLPVVKEFEFLRKSCLRKMADDSEGFRIRTATLRGQVSQGICFPLDIFTTFRMEEPFRRVWADGLVLVNPYVLDLSKNADFYTFNFKVGDDVTEWFNIKKWEEPIPACLNGKVKGGMPGFIRTTDEERIQNIPWVFAKHAGKMFYETEKLDGTSSTYYFNEGVFGVVGRNWEYEPGDDTYWRIARSLEIERRFRREGRNLAVQGEIIGEGINRAYKIKGQHLYIYNAFDIDGSRYLSYPELDLVVRTMGLEMVPFLDTFILQPDDTVDTILARANGPSVINSQIAREGVVIRSLIEEREPDIITGRLSFKAVSNKYILKHDA